MVWAFLLIGLSVFAQDKISTKTGVIEFEASVPSFEEVKAKNEAVTCILNTKTGEIASLALFKGFRFKVALMEEHFNENYVNSQAHPKATFKGELLHFDFGKVDQKGKIFSMKGILSMNGHQKEIKTTAVVKRNVTSLEVSSTFEINPEDFGIKIPSVVKNKIAKKVKISTFFELQ
jgi:hypothetical protein